MEENRLELPGFGELNAPPSPTASMARHLQAEGTRVQELEHTLAWRADRVVFPYEIRVKYPRVHSHEHMAIVKWASLDGPLIAFHTGRGVIGALTSMSDRYRMGRLQIKPDEYPPEDFDKVMAHIQERLEFLQGLRSGPSVGS